MEKRRPADIMDLAAMVEDVFGQYADCDGYREILLDGRIGGVSAVVANQALSQGKNLYLGLINKDSQQQSLLSILYTTACRLLLTSDRDYLPPIEKGEHKFFIDDKHIWRYRLEGKNHLKVRSEKKGGTRTRNISDINTIHKRLFVCHGDSEPEFKYLKRLKDYKEFYSSLTGAEIHPPSFFQKKIMVVCNKSDLIQRLKDVELRHCFPILNLNSNNFNGSNGSLPIDPLIIIASDYEAAREYYLTNKDKWDIEYLIMSTDSSVRTYRSQVKNDWASKYFANCCLIGTDIIQDDNLLSLWHWNRNEEGRIGGLHELDWVMEPLGEEEQLTQAIANFNVHLRMLEDDFGSYEHFKMLRYTLYDILGDKIGRIDDFDVRFDKALEEVSKNLLSDYNEKEDFEDDLDKAIELLRSILDAKNNCGDYLELLETKHYNNMPIVVHSRSLEYWKNEFRERYGHDDNIITFWQFYGAIQKNDYASGFVFVNRLTNKQIDRLSMLLTQREITLRMCLYAYESDELRLRLRSKRKYNYSTEGPKDSTLFPQFDFDIRRRESVDDTIERFYLQDLNHEDGLDRADDYDNVNTSYNIKVINSEGKEDTVRTSLNVLKEHDGHWNIAALTELGEGDIIMIYSNKSRQSLFETLTKGHDVYSRINECSDKWKKAFIQSVVNAAYSDSSATDAEDSSTGNNEGNPTQLIAKIREIERLFGKGFSNIYKQWISPKSQILFPALKNLERLLYFLIENEVISKEEAKEIKDARSAYMGISISLGHNLSSEAQDIILQNAEDLQEYINLQVVGNGSQYPVLSQFSAINIKQFLESNFDQYVFQRIVEEEEDDEE